MLLRWPPSACVHVVQALFLSFSKAFLRPCSCFFSPSRRAGARKGRRRSGGGTLVPRRPAPPLGAPAIFVPAASRSPCSSPATIFILVSFPPWTHARAPMCPRRRALWRAREKQKGAVHLFLSRPHNTSETLFPALPARSLHPPSTPLAPRTGRIYRLARASAGSEGGPAGGMGAFFLGCRTWTREGVEVERESIAPSRDGRSGRAPVPVPGPFSPPTQGPARGHALPPNDGNWAGGQRRRHPF